MVVLQTGARPTKDSFGLAVVETDDEQALREFAAQDPGS